MVQSKIIVINDGWHGLWYRIGAQARNAWQVYFGVIIARYAEPHRYYHDYSHIVQLLSEFREVRHLCKNPDAVEMFLRLHDLIYKIGAKDNEEQSAEMTESILIQARLPEDFSAGFIEETKRFILLSKDHLADPADIDGSLSVDLDLSILGQEPNVFNRYERNIWKEYVWAGGMQESKFVQGRSEILNKFLDRKQIYATPYFHKKYEKQTQANVERSLKQLNAKKTYGSAEKENAATSGRIV